MYTHKTNYGVMPKTIGGLIEDVFQNGFQKVFGEENWNHGVSAPVNIKEADDAYEMYIMAPGLRKEDFKINVDRNVLHVSYEYKEDENPDLKSRWLRREYKLQTFRRSFTLNDKINVGAIAAAYNDGVLVLTMPKKASAEPTTQEIKVG